MVSRSHHVEGVTLLLDQEVYLKDYSIEKLTSIVVEPLHILPLLKIIVPG